MQAGNAAAGLFFHGGALRCVRPLSSPCFFLGKAVRVGYRHVERVGLSLHDGFTTLYMLLLAGDMQTKKRKKCTGYDFQKTRKNKTLAASSRTVLRAQARHVSSRRWTRACDTSLYNTSWYGCTLAQLKFCGDFGCISIFRCVRDPYFPGRPQPARRVQLSTGAAQCELWHRSLAREWATQYLAFLCIRLVSPACVIRPWAAAWVHTE